MKTHKLKTWPEFFKAVLGGSKTFEVRKDDRVFMVGDILVLQEFDIGEYTGRAVTVEVTYKLHGGMFGIEKGYCVMGLKKLQ